MNGIVAHNLLRRHTTTQLFQPSQTRLAICQETSHFGAPNDPKSSKVVYVRPHEHLMRQKEDSSFRVGGCRQEN
ncbi:hypothetical protein N7534_008317 [Penicillium rubens]|nr:hypothetical protein N7524_003658 [Penicillium chrysogenum]KAJ5848999.1 hypothetical protein N7534_008317 [Penicillium rubens]